MDKTWKCPLFNTKSQQKNKKGRIKTELNFKEESDNIEVWTFKSNFFLSSLKQTERKKIIMMKKKKKNKQKHCNLPVILSKTKENIFSIFRD